LDAALNSILADERFSELFSEPVVAPPAPVPAAAAAAPGDGDDMNVEQGTQPTCFKKKFHDFLILLKDEAPPVIPMDFGANLMSKQKKLRYIDVGDQSKLTALHLAGMRTLLSFTLSLSLSQLTNELCSL